MSNKQKEPDEFLPASSVVRGDRIKWTEPVFEGGSFGRYRRAPTKIGERTIFAEVIRESYGAEKQQHTFSLLVISSEGTEAPEPGAAIRRKGRNLYRNDCLRLRWDDESKRGEVAEEKHKRGAAARAAREERKQGFST